jgi:hypothetical protein
LVLISAVGWSSAKITLATAKILGLVPPVDQPANKSWPERFVEFYDKWGDNGLETEYDALKLNVRNFRINISKTVEKLAFQHKALEHAWYPSRKALRVFQGTYSGRKYKGDVEDNAWGTIGVHSPRGTLDGSFLKFMKGMRETADLNLESAIKRCLTTVEGLQKIVLDGAELEAGGPKGNKEVEVPGKKDDQKS